MKTDTEFFPETTAFKYAGLLYLAIIALGLGAELGLRAPALMASDPGAALMQHPYIPTLSLLMDALMITADIGLAVLLFSLLAINGVALSLFAALFRLTQAVVLAGNLTHLQSASLSLKTGNQSAALDSMALHSAGYDIGLIFFGLSCFFTAALILRDARFRNWLGWMIAATGAVYITGTGLHVSAPPAFEAFQPAYLIAIVTEFTFASTLLLKGMRSKGA